MPKSLQEHLDTLVKITGCTQQEILECGLKNNMEINDNGLLIWNTKEEMKGKYLNLMFVSGFGKELWKRINKIKDKEGCVGMFCVTKRPKGIAKKYGFRSLGTLMVREGK